MDIITLNEHNGHNETEIVFDNIFSPLYNPSERENTHELYSSFQGRCAQPFCGIHGTLAGY
jgi:hypothetical protein